MPLDGCAWNMSIILWDASYFRHSNKIHTTKALVQNFWWNYNKNEICKPYLGNEEQKLLFSSCFTLRHTHWLSFCTPLFVRVKSGPQINLRTRKIGRVEVNLSSLVYPRKETTFIFLMYVALAVRFN